MSDVYNSSETIYTFSSIEKVLFGINAVAQLATEIKRLNVGKRGLIISDSGIRKAGLIEKVLKHLDEQFYVEIYDETASEPTIESVQDAADYAREIKPDFIIGVGGGSSMDTAKIVGKALTNPGDLRLYLNKGFRKAGVPVIAIPTTAGTGAECTPDAVVALPEEKVKYWFDDVRAKIAIVDPLMTLTLPPHLTAATGIDALSHAIESALSVSAFPLTQTLALGAIKLISENIRTATYNGNDVKARYSMALAALMAGFSEGNAGVVEAHAIAHTIGAYYHIHHGLACGIALPYAMQWNLPVNLNILAQISTAIDEETRRLPIYKAAQKGIYAVKKLLEDLNLPTSLSMIEGADRKDLSEIAEILTENPRAYPAFAENCKRKMSKEDIKKFLEKMWEGTL